MRGLLLSIVLLSACDVGQGDRFPQPDPSEECFYIHSTTTCGSNGCIDHAACAHCTAGAGGYCNTLAWSQECMTYAVCMAIQQECNGGL